MLYGQIKKQYDNKYINKSHFLIKNELYTMSEIKKLNISEHCYNIVILPKNKSYFFFGARFNSLQNR